jgi:hypothetical protein
MAKVKFIKNPASQNMAYSLGDVIDASPEFTKRLLELAIVEVIGETIEAATAQTTTETATRNRRPKK